MHYKIECNYEIKILKKFEMNIDRQVIIRHVGKRVGRYYLLTSTYYLPTYKINFIMNLNIYMIPL
jgi:hypothetical protein